MKNLLFFLSIGILLPFKYSFAQNRKIDSLNTLLKIDKEDTNKVKHLIKVGDAYKIIGGYDSTIQCSKRALLLSQQLNFKKGVANSYNNIGHIYFIQGDYSKALENLHKALKIDEELKNKKGMSTRLGNIGNVYKDQGNYLKALDTYLKALKIDEELGNKSGIARHLCNIGIIYKEQADYPKTLDYYLKAKQVYEELEDKNGMALILGNIGSVYHAKKDYSKTLDYYFKALKIDEESENKNGIARHLGNIGIVYKEQAECQQNPDSAAYRGRLYKTAFNNYFKALKISEEIGDKNLYAIWLGNIGSLYISLLKYNDAYTYLYRALATDDSINIMDGVKDDYLGLSTLYEKSNIPLLDTIGGKLLNMEQMRLRSKYYYVRYISIRDTLFSEENKKQLVRKEMNYEFDKKEAIAQAEHEKQAAVAAAESKRQQIFIWLVAAVALAIGIIAIIILRSLRITKKQKNIIEKQKDLVEKQKQKVEEHQKEILDSIYYARRIQRSLLTSEKYIERNLNKLRKSG